MHKLFVILVGALTLVGCDKHRVFESYNATPNMGWHIDSIQKFTLPELDSLKNYNLYFSIRNNNKYAFSNLFVIASIEYPKGKKQIDTLEYQMALPSGEWLGEGGLTKENKLWFKKNYKFVEKGTYKVSVKQSMRSNGSADGVTYLKGITDVGLRAETVENP